MSEEPPSTNINIAVVVKDPIWRLELEGAEQIARGAARAVLDHEGARDFLVRHRLWPAESPQGRGDPGSAELVLVLADDRLVRGLNRDYRGQDRPTNVLSFAGLDGSAETAADTPLMLGDVVLARETIAREAEAQGKIAAEHLAHLVVHGALHLVGYDHGTAPEAERMESLERAIMAGLGFADPYRDRMVPAGADS